MWHCCNKCMVAKFRSVWYPSSPTSLTNVAKPRSRTKRARVSHSCLSHSSSVDKKEWRKRAKFNCVRIFFLLHGIIWCAAFIVRNKFEQLKTEGSCFIFSILFLSGNIIICTFLWFRIKKKLAFLAVHRLISCAKNLWNCTTHNKGLKLIKLTIISSTEQCVPPAHKFEFLWEWLFCSNTLCSLVFKALSLSSLVRLSRLLNGCGATFAFVSQLYLLSLLFPLLTTFSVFLDRGQRSGPPCFTVLELWVIS